MEIQSFMKRIMEGMSILHKNRDNKKATVDMWFTFNGMDFIIQLRRPGLEDFIKLGKAKENEKAKIVSSKQGT